MSEGEGCCLGTLKRITPWVLAAAAFGALSWLLAFINIGDKALSPGTPDFWLAIGLLLLLLLITALLGKKCFPKEKEHEQQENCP